MEGEWHGGIDVSDGEKATGGGGCLPSQRGMAKKKEEKRKVSYSRDEELI